MKVWEVEYVLNDWDNDDDRGIILQISNNIYKEREKAKREFDVWKKEMHLENFTDPEDYVELIDQPTYAYLEEKYRMQSLTLRQKEIID